MSYNIFNSADYTLQQIVEVIKKESPDYLNFNEADTFTKDNNSLLKEFATKTGFSYFDIALSEEIDYRVAVFSKFPLRNVVKIKPLKRACLIAEVNVPVLGDISIASHYLTPFSVDFSHPEIDLILKAQELSDKRILIVNMNPFSYHDKYSGEMIDNFSAMDVKKFTNNGRLRFDAIKKIEESGYKDCAVIKRKTKEETFPTLPGTEKSAVKMRLDYIFVSKPLVPFVKSYSVVKNSLTDATSDHYPITVELKEDK